MRISGSSKQILKNLAHLYKACCVIAIEVSDDEQLVSGKLELVDAGMEKLEGCCLASLLLIEIEFGLINDQGHTWLQSIVDVHEWIASAKSSPYQGNNVSILISFFFFLQQLGLEAGYTLQALTQVQAYLEE